MSKRLRGTCEFFNQAGGQCELARAFDEGKPQPNLAERKVRGPLLQRGAARDLCTSRSNGGGELNAEIVRLQKQCDHYRTTPDSQNPQRDYDKRSKVKPFKKTL